MSRILDVYLCDNFAGTLIQDKDGELEFSYDKRYAEKAKHGISISMPLTKEEPEKSSNNSFKGKKVKAFFSGLLPEESVRERLAKYLGISDENPFALLEVVGGECAGALALYPQGEKPSQELDASEALDDIQLQEILKIIKTRPMLAGDNGCRLSLAGAQDKIAVRFKNGKFHLTKGSAPTTHIIKPIISHAHDSTYNELFCMRLAQRIGIEAPKATLHFIGDTPLYLIERYDRKVGTDGKINRIHQEDFCQALGLPPEFKYEREGGPNISSCQKIIDQHTAKPASNQIKLTNIIIFNYLIGNADAHGKNFSLLYKERKPELAPAYDLLSTAVYPNLSEKMAMKIGGKYKPQDICLRHFHKLVPNTKTAQAVLSKQIQAMSEKTAKAAVLLREEFQKEGIVSNIFEEIIKVIEKRSKNINH